MSDFLQHETSDQEDGHQPPGKERKKKILLDAGMCVYMSLKYLSIEGKSLLLAHAKAFRALV